MSRAQLQHNPIRRYRLNQLPEKEVLTHEVPEEDVPGKYLEKE
jgi:hypothetical protein